MTEEPRLWCNMDFARLFAAQVTSLVGSGVTNIALAALAFQLAGAQATTIIGFALTLRILAFVTLSPIAGILADRVDRKRMACSSRWHSCRAHSDPRTSCCLCCGR